MTLPPLPPRDLLADLCRVAAARENVEPQLIEKDFYLTRLLWALSDKLGNELLLKGGTLLSKVDLGFFRMSEDADFVLPAFVELVDLKLAEVDAAPLNDQPPSFDLDREHRQRLDASHNRDLIPVLRKGAPAFDLDAMLSRFNRLWGPDGPLRRRN